MSVSSRAVGVKPSGSVDGVVIDIVSTPYFALET